MRKIISNTAMILLLVLFLAEALMGYSVSWVTAAAAAVVLVFNLPYIGKTFRAPAWIFFILGSVILIASGAPLSQWIYGMNSMLKTVVILISVQTLSLAIGRGGYEKAVSDCLGSGISNIWFLYCLLMVISHILASVMSLGSVIIILVAIMPAIHKKMDNENDFVVSAVTCGYCTLFLWAPGTVTVLMSMQVFDIGWQEYFMPAFALAVFGIILGAVVSWFSYGGKKLKSEEANKKVNIDSLKKLGGLVLVMAIIIVGIGVLEKLKFSTSVGRLLIVTLLVAFVWLLMQTGRRFFKEVPAEWWNSKLPKNGDLSAFFLSMGVFSAAISYSGIENVMVRLASQYPLLFQLGALWTLPLIIVVLSLIGIHPFVSVLMVGPIMAGMELPYSNLQMGLAMSLGCCVSYMVSPFAGLILTLSNGLKEKPAHICFKVNLLFAVIYYITAEVLILFFAA